MEKGIPATGPRVAYLSTYLPRRCGIAAFTHELITAIDRYTNHLAPAIAIAMNDGDSIYNYGPRVRYQIKEDEPSSYLQAAEAINDSQIDLVNVQHEYGIFGGRDGEYILYFLKEMRKPVVTTLHTVVPKSKSTPHKREVTSEIAARSEAVVVMAQEARAILIRDYGVEQDKIHYIPHGVASIKRQEGLRRLSKRRLGLDGHRILATFGLISHCKGIEYVIRALPRMIKKHPETIYLVLGETHPKARMRHGESYRQRLQMLSRGIGVGDHVRFVKRYLTPKELTHYLLATDIYLVPYLNPHQICSSTLAHAVGVGKAAVATPFVYAKEVLADGRGFLVDFRDSVSIAQAVCPLLSDRKLLLETERCAYEHSQRWVWPKVARQYLKVFRSALQHPTNHRDGSRKEEGRNA